MHGNILANPAVFSDPVDPIPDDNDDDIPLSYILASVDHLDVQNPPLFLGKFLDELEKPFVPHPYHLKRYGTSRQPKSQEVVNKKTIDQRLWFVYPPQEAERYFVYIADFLKFVRLTG